MTGEEWHNHDAGPGSVRAASLQVDLDLEPKVDLDYLARRDFPARLSQNLR